MGSFSSSRKWNLNYKGFQNFFRRKKCSIPFKELKKMPIRRKDLQDEIKQLMGRNTSLLFENEMLKKIVNYYERYIFLTSENEEMKDEIRDISNQA